MDRYTRVEKPKPESPINENEIRITSGGPVRNYISYATSLLQEKHVKEIVLKAMGQAISKTVSVAENIKVGLPFKLIFLNHQYLSPCSPLPVKKHVELTSCVYPNTAEKSSFAPRYCHQLNTPGLNDYNHLIFQRAEQNVSRTHMAGDVVEGEDGTGAGVDMDMETIRVAIKETIREITKGAIRETIKNNPQFTLSPIDNGGYSNWGRGGGRGRSWGYRGTGYERGRGGGGRGGGGGGRGYGRGRGRGRMGNHPRGGGGNQA
ncbi:unnamed protein product [Dovyalis caffra]|uniref:DNA/RNA-binding protein Alba-like domain-containing protein n=1 Tax=Dovyalis caffra TaxID=77055 RepID=A0AAV1SEZ4_9ROSI|nr:unnamed protein product [Dovyalis caffra]